MSEWSCLKVTLVMGVSSSLINPQCTCAARVTAVFWPNSCVYICLSVCVSVTTLAEASFGSMLRKRYVQHWYRLFLVLS